MSDSKKQVDPAVRKAFARAECFWDIIGKAGISTGLGMKIGDVGYDKLSDAEKLLLVKVSTLLVRGNDEIEKAFQKQAEDEKTQAEADKQKAEAEKAQQIQVEGIAPEAQETPQGFTGGKPEIIETEETKPETPQAKAYDIASAETETTVT